jgi:hypothetical protein
VVTETDGRATTMTLGRQRGPGALLKNCRATQTQDERRPARVTAPIDAYDASYGRASHDRRHSK